MSNVCSAFGHREVYQNIEIKLILVKPYLSAEINDHKSYYKNLYNSIIIPEELYNAHYKSAITKRNKWMIDNSNYVITYVCRNFGGAYSAMRYAQEKGKLYINLADKKTAFSK